MHHDIEVISDGDGFAVIGPPSAVERFLRSEGLASRDLGLNRLAPAVAASAGVARAGATIAETSGRWVKLTEKSAQAFRSSSLMKGSEAGVARAITTENGKINGILEVVRTPASMLTNPAVLSGAAGLMAQIAMQQAMDEISDYLVAIDEKVDDLLRAQKDAVFADMLAVELIVDDAMTVREQVGRVGDVTWSKVQGTSMTIARTQSYALLQLDALAGKLERQHDVGELARTSKDLEGRVQEWLAVLARCSRLQDAVAVLELDRVLDSSPDELDDHRLALRAARQNRLDAVGRSTEKLLARVDAATRTANAKVLLHPTSARAVIASSNTVSTTVGSFHEHLGIDREGQSWQTRRWLEAAADVKDKVLETGAEGAGVARRLGTETLGRARTVGGRISGSVTESRRRRRDGAAEDPSDEDA